MVLLGHQTKSVPSDDITVAQEWCDCDDITVAQEWCDCDDITVAQEW